MNLRALLMPVALLASTLTPTAAQEARLAVQLRMDVAEPRAGDEIPVTFIVTNVGTRDYPFDDRDYDHSGRMGEFALQALDEQGIALVDPRTTSRVVRGGIGGGLSTPTILKPGARFSKTIALNLWAHVHAPGFYQVRGKYADEPWTAPVAIRVMPSSDAELAVHIQELSLQLARGGDTPSQVHAIQQLMYTGDRRVVGPLLAITDQAGHEGNVGFWIQQAFLFHLPKDDAVRNEVLARIRQTGLMASGILILEELDTPHDQIVQIIEQGLGDVRDAARREAAVAAQRYHDDRFASALCWLALNGAADTRIYAVTALAMHRTDEGVATLKQLLRVRDAAVRNATRRAVQTAIDGGFGAVDRRLRAEDFPELTSRQ